MGNINEEDFGEVDNKAVRLYSLVNANELVLKTTNYGAIVTAIMLPEKNGNYTDVVLGFDTLEDYIKSGLSDRYPYFGAAIGRYAGRIKNGNLQIENRKIQLDCNEKNNHLHGGYRGFDKLVWNVEALQQGANPSISYSYTSKDGEGQYPGELKTTITYTLTGKNEFKVSFFATTNRVTAVNLTQHTYFNLNGKGDISNHNIQLNAHNYLEKEADGIATGNIRSVLDTAVDFNKPVKGISDVDHSFVIDDNKTRAGYISNGRIEVATHTNQPILHVYSGDYIPVTKGKKNSMYGPTSGICLETQSFPVALHQKFFPMCLLTPDEVYYHETVYRFTYDKL